MPTVDELIKALNADKSPFINLLEGVAGGYATAQQNRIANAKAILEIDQLRQKQELDAQDRARSIQNDQFYRDLISHKTEDKVQNDLKATGTPPAVLPVQKFKVGLTTDDKGFFKPKIDIEEPKDPTYQAKDYLDEATNKNRVGSYNPVTGELIRKPTDPLAPRPAAELNLGEKQNQYTQKRLTALGDALDPSKQRQGSFGVSKQVFDRAERLQTLANAYADGNIDSRQMEEIAIGLNAMLSGSNVGAQSQVAALVPKTAMGSWQKLKEWLVNEPQGTAQQEFVRRMMGSVEREKKTAADQMKRTQLQRIARYHDLEKTSPDEFYNTIQAAGLDPEEYRQWKAGGMKPIDAVQTQAEMPARTSANGYLHTATNPKTGQRIGTRDGKNWERIQ